MVTFTKREFKEVRKMKKHCTDFWTVMESPMGDLILNSDGEALTGLTIAPSAAERKRLTSGTRRDGLFVEAKKQLKAYFSGKLQRFDLPLHLEGTEFQERVWKALRRIPHGKTLSYAVLAEKVGKPKASRAVGNANGKNPLPIIVPCHRVIAHNGGLGGYTGGLEKKRFLLKLEGLPDLV